MNISLCNLESYPEVYIGIIGCIRNENIKKNPPGTIRGKCPRVIKPGSLEIFESIIGMSIFFNRSASICHGTSISAKNLDATVFSKMLGARLFLKLKKMGAKILKLRLNEITPTLITLTQITMN